MEINPLDKFNMKLIIQSFPAQLTEELAVSGTLPHYKPSSIILCALGGSALPGNIIGSYFQEMGINLPLMIHRDYGLPRTISENPLVICVSYSGNTEETLSAFKEALEKKLKVVAVSSGGQLEIMAKDNNIPWIKIPRGIQPRCATGYLFQAMVNILHFCGCFLAPDFKTLADELSQQDKKLEEEGKNLSEKINGNILLIYASSRFKHIARLWKIKFNENSKTPAFYNYFPELNHNEMMSFSNAPHEKFCAIILRSTEDHPRNLKRMRLSAEILQEKGITTNFVDIPTGNYLSAVFQALILGDWTSYYLALKKNIDPSPVEIGEEFKKKMKE